MLLSAKHDCLHISLRVTMRVKLCLFQHKGQELQSVVADFSLNPAHATQRVLIATMAAATRHCSKEIKHSTKNLRCHKHAMGFKNARFRCKRHLFMLLGLKGLKPAVSASLICKAAQQEIVCMPVRNSQTVKITSCSHRSCYDLWKDCLCKLAQMQEYLYICTT